MSCLLATRSSSFCIHFLPLGIFMLSCMHNKIVTHTDSILFLTVEGEVLSVVCSETHCPGKCLSAPFWKRGSTDSEWCAWPPRLPGSLGGLWLLPDPCPCSPLPPHALHSNAVFCCIFVGKWVTRLSLSFCISEWKGLALIQNSL